MAQASSKDWRVYRTLSQATPQLRDADLLQYRAGGGLISRVIRVFGRSPYSHSAMVCMLGGAPWRVEVREFYGGRHDPLSTDVNRYSGKIDVFRPCSVFVKPARDGTSGEYTLDAAGARRTMLELTKPGAYGYLGVLAAASRHLPGVRWLTKMSIDDKLERGWPPFCSQAYVYALRQNFIDPVPFCPDYLTEPGDLTRSAILSNYLFTLIKDKD